MGVKDYDLNPDNNTQINGINIAEGCPPSGINNAMRQLMADVKEDSDAQDTAIEALENKAKTPASAEELGPVKVGDGLTMGEDGTLSADLATAEAAGRVKASTTAQAGAVPLGGDDGSLGEDWLKKAMEAAEAAQKKADDKTTPAQVAEYGAPDYSRIVKIDVTDTFQYKVPADGFIKLNVTLGTNGYVYFHGSLNTSDNNNMRHLWGTSTVGFVQSGMFPVEKGMYLKRQYSNVTSGDGYFIPAKGADWDA